MHEHTLQTIVVSSLCAVAAVGCGPPDVGSASTFLIYDRNAETGEYEWTESRIETLRDVDAVAGDVASLRGGGTIQLDESDPSTRREFRNSIRVTNSRRPQLDYDLRNGVVVPWDFHSGMMLSLYHHIERAHDFFVSVGVSEDRLGEVPVYYYARLQIVVPVDLLSDNAAYAFTLDAFLIPPTLVLREVPLAANRGVVVHEYSHLVFNRLVHGGARAPDYLLEPWPDPAVNRMRSIDEGVADLFAALQTNDPNFIDPSISNELFDIDRDLSTERHYDRELLKTVETSSRSTYNPYELGTVVASALWTLKDDLDDERLARALIDTLRSFSDVGPDLSVADFFNIFVRHLPEERREAACQSLRARLDAVRGGLSCDP